MPRDSNGNYVKPAGTTAVSGNVIDPTAWNSLTTDLGNEITASLPRDGSAGMTGVAKLADGAVGAPGLAFGLDLGVGIYRKTTSTGAIVSGSVEALTWSPTNITMTGAVALTGGITQNGNIATNGNISVSSGQTFTATTTNTTTGLSAISGASRTLGPFVGSTLTGTGIPANTVVSAITYNGDGTVATITMSNAATATGSITVTAGGTISAAQDPVLALHVAPKQYVDAKTALQSITATVAANALTVGYVPQGAVSFRNPTLTNGAPVSATPATLSLVVPSTATLGTVSGVQAQLALILLYNAGTPALGIANVSGTLNFDETALISTTAISAGATSASVVYSTSAITNSPFRVVGYINSTQATAGTWATAPSLIQGLGGQVSTPTSKISVGTQQATTSGTAIDFTGIPSWVDRVTVILNGVSTNGTSDPLLRLGSGSIQTTGYLSTSTRFYFSGGTGSFTGSSTAGFLVKGVLASTTLTGTIVLTRISGNTWIASGKLIDATATVDPNIQEWMVGGSVTLAGPIDRLRYTTTNGTDAFDAGAINIMWE